MIEKLEYETHRDGNGNVYGSIPSYAEILDKINEVIDYINSRPEEKPSEDLEEAANKFAVSYDQGTCDGIAQECFIAGAKWMNEQIMKDLEEDALLLERAWLTLDNLGYEELAERLKTFKEKYANKM